MQKANIVEKSRALFSTAKKTLLSIIKKRITKNTKENIIEDTLNYKTYSLLVYSSVDELLSATRQKLYNSNLKTSMDKHIKTLPTSMTDSIKNTLINTIKNDGRILKESIYKHKEKLVMGATVVCVMIVGGLTTYNSMTAFQYSYDGEVLGVAKSQEEVLASAEMAEMLIKENFGTEVDMSQEDHIKFERIMSNNRQIDTSDDVVENLVSAEKTKTRSCTIFADKKPLAVVDSKETAKQILYEITSTAIATRSASEFKSIGFMEEVTLKNTKTDVDKITSSPKALDYINTGGVEKKIHVIENDETVWHIAQDNDMTEEELLEMNPDVDPHCTKNGDKIKLYKEVPLLNVKTVEEVTYKEKYEGKTEYIDSDLLYKGDEVTKKKGKTGLRKTTADLIKKNGTEIERKITDTQPIKEAVSPKVLKGTKENPKTIGKGYYSWPMKGRFTSKFGSRWGRKHLGIDLAADIGTAVNAADGGKVIEAGDYNNGYGLAIRIDHGNGRETMYAHNNKLKVKVGDTVYRGQKIAESGNTGFSTGPHLHFEVIIDGTHKNPMKYLTDLPKSDEE